MSAAKHKILIEQGALFEIILTVKDAASDRVDLTGFEFIGKVRKAPEDTAALASFSFDILDQNSAETKGQVRAFLSTSTTSAIAVPGIGEGRRNVAEYIYDIKYGPAAGEKLRLLEGIALVSAEASS